MKCKIRFKKEKPESNVKRLRYVMWPCIIDASMTQDPRCNGSTASKGETVSKTIY